MPKTARTTKVAATASAPTASARSSRAKTVMTTAQKLKAALDASAEKAMVPKAGTTVGTSRPKATADLKPTPGATKAATVLTMLQQPNGATLDALQQATGWQAHSVRGFLSGMVKKRMALSLRSERGDDGVRRYRITDASIAATKA